MDLLNFYFGQCDDMVHTIIEVNRLWFLESYNTESKSCRISEYFAGFRHLAGSELVNILQVVLQAFSWE